MLDPTFLFSIAGNLFMAIQPYDSGQHVHRFGTTVGVCAKRQSASKVINVDNIMAKLTVNYKAVWDTSKNEYSPYWLVLNKSYSASDIFSCQIW